MRKPVMEVFPAFFVWKRAREYKAGRFTYVSNAVLSPPPGTDTSPGAARLRSK
jgi:hypothetical protein